MKTDIVRAAEAVCLRRIVTDPVRDRHRELLLDMMEDELPKLRGLRTLFGPVDVNRVGDAIIVAAISHLQDDGSWSVWRELVRVRIEEFGPRIVVQWDHGGDQVGVGEYYCAGEAVRAVIEALSEVARP